MKTNHMFFVATLAINLASCTSSTPLQVLQPAQMVVPDHIRTVATLDRSKPEKGFENFLEGLLTGENIGQDRQGRRYALEGLTESLTRTPRFDVKNTGIELVGSRGGNSFAAPLDWREVERICRDYATDALVTIETFDTDNSISYSERREKRKDKDGKEYTDIRYDARLDMTMRIGWRLYDPKSRVIQDEFTTITQASDTQTADTKENALRRLYDQSSITRNISYDAGTQYGMRIAPVWITVNRPFYGSGKGSFDADMERAARFAKADKWEDAATIWQNVVRNADDKTAGRAAFNLGVANERAGLLDSALEWAQRAYTDFGNKNARNYIRELQIRISDRERLRQQLKEKV